MLKRIFSLFKMPFKEGHEEGYRKHLKGKRHFTKEIESVHKGDKFQRRLERKRIRAERIKGCGNESDEGE